MNDWIITTEWQHNGRNLTPGVELSVKEDGRWRRYRFQRHVLTPAGVEWVDVIGDTGFRSFRPERIGKVHRTRTVATMSELHELYKSKARERRAA